MASEREIVRYLNDVQACAALAARLAARSELAASEDALDFLEKIARRSETAPLSRRQTEFLLAIRDDNELVRTLHRFDLAAVLRSLWVARADIADESDVAFLERLRERGQSSFRVAEARRLLRVARGVDGLLD